MAEANRTQWLAQSHFHIRKNQKEMARLLDMSLLEELQREGFFDRISR